MRGVRVSPEAPQNKGQPGHMNRTQEIIQFAIDRKVGLNLDSDRSAIEAALGRLDHADDQCFLLGDLEIGIVSDREDLPFQNVSYFKFRIGWIDRNRFRIPGLIDVKYGVADIDLREVVQILVDRSIWFKHIYHFADDENDRVIWNSDRSRSFFFKQSNGRWVLDCYYCNEI